MKELELTIEGGAHKHPIITLGAGATRCWRANTRPTTEPLEIVIVYYLTVRTLDWRATILMVKPIQDALAGPLAYSISSYIYLAR